MKYQSEIRERTKRFAIRTIRITGVLKKSDVDYPICRQLLRSGTSIGANVTEAKASSSRKELIRYLEIALKSANETSYWLEIIKEGYSLQQDLSTDQKELSEIRKVLGKIIYNLKHSKTEH